METNSETMERRIRKILNALPKGIEKSTGRICSDTGIHFYQTENTLLQLEEEGVVEKAEKPMGTFWRLVK